MRYGARIDVVNSGNDALEHLKNKHYDVVICDQRMPTLSGQRLYHLVNSAHPELQDRFLFVTGDVITGQTDKFFKEAGVQVLRKPFRIQDLVDAVEGLLSRNPPQSF